MSLCLAAGGVVVAVALKSFTLAWTHSIEHTRWEEDYLVEGGRLLLVEARIQAHGAGMEPPPGSRFEHGVWHYKPAVAPLSVLRLMNSRFGGEYEVCSAGTCKPLSAYAPTLPAHAMVELSACQR